MTTFLTVTIHCDRCADWEAGAPVPKRSGSPGSIVTPLLRRLKKRGWSRDTKSQWVDLCPRCVEESRKDPR